MSHASKVSGYRATGVGWQSTTVPETYRTDELLAEMPCPETYEAEYQYWPWGELIKFVADQIVNRAPVGGTVYDYMCGTGHLLAVVRSQRPDLRLFGCDIDKGFVEFAKTKRPELDIVCSDAFAVSPRQSPDLIVCTAGLHHLRFERHQAFINKLRHECGKQTILVIGEQALGDYSEEASRKRSALRLSYELLDFGMKSGWPEDQVNAAIEVMRNDLFLRGEYKRSATQWHQLLRSALVTSYPHWTWGDPTSGGDTVFICRLP
jgi:SAM-dependent methyltransferase